MIEVYAVPVVPKDDSKTEEKKGKFKNWVKSTVRKAKCFWEENKETIVAMAPVVIGGVTVLAKVITRQQKIHQEQVLKDRYVWDPKLGHYWLTNRKLSNTEWTEIERRKNNGESMGNILASMKVLKL